MLNLSPWLDPSPIRALLIDLEGTLYQAGLPIPGAPEALAALSNGIGRVFVTNTTSRPRSVIVRELAATGVRAEAARVFTAPVAAGEYLRSRGLHRCHFLLNAPVVQEDLAGIEADDVSPEAVVVGDIGGEFTFARLNKAFRFLLDGAAFVTLARNRYYRAAEGLLLDQGPFVAALEYATGRAATLVGKPSPEFFRAALGLLGVPASEAAVVGDDLESDVGGGQAAGMRGFLVRTGKFRQGDLEASSVEPDAVLDSLAELPRLLGIAPESGAAGMESLG